MTWRLTLADCRKVMTTIPTSSVDAIITDPPYPCIDREYGSLTEQEWHDLMDSVVAQARRVLRPSGSAVFVLEPNASQAGRMRPWLWEFAARWSVRWGLVQDWYWMRTTGMPQGGATYFGLLKGSCKWLVWLGPPDCYRDQGAVLWDESDENRSRNQAARCARARLDDTHTSPSGYRRNRAKVHAAAAARGGIIPPNVWPMPHTSVRTGWGAETPIELADRMVRYLCPPGGLVLDPFAGGGNIGVAAIRAGRSYHGIEITPHGHMVATSSLMAAEQDMREESARCSARSA